jgi:hypothetical protein
VKKEDWEIMPANLLEIKLRVNYQWNTMRETIEQTARTMKIISLLVAVVALAASGCASTNGDNTTPTTQNQPYAPPLHPPSANTMNNPPSVTAPPAPSPH